MQLADKLHQELLKKYTYKRSSPEFANDRFEIYHCTHKEMNLPMTLKIIYHCPPQLARYLKRLKDIKLEQVIKIYEFGQTDNYVFIAQEQANICNLGQALAKCRKLDDNDSIFIAKLLLNAHVDLLRSDFHWFGTEEDIEITDSGIKLSWNNTIPFTLQNPFPSILSRVAGRNQIQTDPRILPVPKNKVLDDLIAISQANASQISLNSNMKKKEKLIRRKGKGWIAIKQSKNDLQYYQQTVLLGINKESGFIKIKIYNEGKIDAEALQLNKTRNTFTKVIDTYNQLGKTYIVSEYSNDGSLFNYINRLKSTGLQLKEDHIEFFFYSLFEPLKAVQESSVVCLSMLHIKNIYIESGIPKIGEPVPLNAQILNQLNEKSEVPDFYHAHFKKYPQEKSASYDTYSLGVLLYKLMFTEYPIFPSGKVHIPTTPQYNKRLKKTLEIFLNQGGRLKEIEKKIEISQEVAKQVQLNKNKLKLEKKKEEKSNAKQGRARRKAHYNEEEEDDGIEKEEQNDEPREDATNNESEYQADEQGSCCRLCCIQLDEPHKLRSLYVNSLQQSPYKSYRICTKWLLIILLYIFLFYFFFLQSTISVLSANGSLQRMNVTISTINYEITVASANGFYKSFNTTSKSLSDLTSLGCFINNYNAGPDYSSSVVGSSSWLGYVVCALLTLVVILVFKSFQLFRFDLIQTLYNMSNVKANYNLSNYLIFNLSFCALINMHFYFYNQIFNEEISICLGIRSNQSYGITLVYHRQDMIQLRNNYHFLQQSHAFPLRFPLSTDRSLRALPALTDNDRYCN